MHAVRALAQLLQQLQDLTMMPARQSKQPDVNAQGAARKWAGAWQQHPKQQHHAS
jgi:hypothetical protein